MSTMSAQEKSDLLKKAEFGASINSVAEKSDVSTDFPDTAELKAVAEVAENASKLDIADPETDEKVKTSTENGSIAPVVPPKGQ